MPAALRGTAAGQLESPAGTFPALAVNGPVTDDELHQIVDSLVPAKDVSKANK